MSINIERALLLNKDSVTPTEYYLHLTFAEDLTKCDMTGTISVEDSQKNVTYHVLDNIQTGNNYSPGGFGNVMFIPITIDAYNNLSAETCNVVLDFLDDETGDININLGPLSIIVEHA